MRMLRTWRLAVLLAGGMSAAVFADHRGDAGPRRPYTLTLDALVGPSGTGVVLRVAAPGGEALPDEIEHALLWTTSSRGAVTWIRIFKDIRLVEGKGSISGLPIPPHARLSAAAEVRIAGSRRVQILSASTVAADRPDLVVSRVDAPATAQLGQIVNIGVVIQETRGYRGATFNVQIREGSTVLDAVTGATIDAMGTTTALFTVRFTAPGTHALTATITGADPEEYSASNNSSPFEIQVVDLLTVNYSLTYQRIEGEFSDNFTSTTSSRGLSDSRFVEEERRYEEIGRHESFSYFFFTDRFVSGVVDFSGTIRVDGLERASCAVTAWSPFASTGGEDWSENTYQAYDPDSDAHFYLDSLWSASSGVSTVFQYYRTAGNYTYHSSGYTRTWASVTAPDPVTGEPVTTVTSSETTSDETGTVVSGTFLDAFRSIQVRAALVAGDTAIGGWTRPHDVVMTTVDRTWDETTGRGGDSMHTWGYERRTYWEASGSGETTP